MINIDEKILLQFAQEQGIIDIALIQQQYDEMNRKKIIEEQKIWQASDGRWKTYIEVAGKRKLIAKANREALEEEIIKAYKDPKVQFRDCFDAWIAEKLEYGEIQRQTFNRYQTDYKRYIKGTELEKKEVKTIDELYLENFIKQRIAEGHLTAKNWSNMRTLIIGTMVYAHKHGYSDMRISLFMSELQLSSKSFRKKIIRDETQVFAKEEEEKIEEFIADNQDDLLLYGAALAFETGMRVGEIAALKWSDYQGEVIFVARTEIKYKDENGDWIITVRESTKGKDGYREVVLTDEAIKILEELRKITGQYEWMFVKDGKRIKAEWLSARVTKMCKELQMPHRSFHKIRKTYATKLLNAGVGDKIIMKQMGHTEILTTKTYYYFNNEQISEIRSKLNKV